MKAFKYIILLTGVAVCGCKKTIDLYPQSNLNTATYYSNTSEVNTALTGCYNAMQKPMLEEWTLTELRSDNSIQGVAGSTSTPNRDLSDLDMFFPSTSHAGNYNYWLSTYYNIRNLNIVLNSLGVNYNEAPGTITYDETPFTLADADRKKMASQASFIRAYQYFNLVRLYGGVFLIHEPVSPIDAKSLNRSPKEDIYKLIIADLLNASANGPTAKFAQIPATDLGRANSWSAKALLAKVYLTLNRKTDAATLLQDIITNSGYSLQASYANVFSITTEMNSEILFNVRYKAGGIGLGSTFANSFAPLNSGSAVVNGDGLGLNYPTAELNNLYTATDARKAVNIGVFGSGSSAKLYPKKHISAVAIVRDAENDWPIIRYADVLLMLAEAQGNSTSSIGLINQVRVRAALTPLDPLLINTTALFENALATERRLEFAFENQRWYDLVRFNTTFTTITAEQTLKNHFAVMYPLHYVNYPSPRLTLAEMQALVTPEKMLLPIPQREIDNNTQLVIPQNPGY
ncbi:MAG: RagB/SusD family nutrient uptake outer membrane protein [Bacteroidetes bacterium]|nr:MAG: RagB/SusD family nutrient uptake outer membrane protein [Bacteroidota bacterium]